MSSENKQALMQLIRDGEVAPGTPKGNLNLPKEQKLLTGIEQAVESRPKWSAPAKLRYLVMERLMRPRYSVRQLVFGLVVLLAGPFIIARAEASMAVEQWQSYSLAYFTMYGVLLSLVLIPLTHELSRRYHSTLESWVSDFDNGGWTPASVWRTMRGSQDDK